MNKHNQKKELLLEIKEHTSDCDANRAQHFNMYNRFNSRLRVIHASEAISLFMLLLYYVVIATFPDLNQIHWINIVPVGISIIAISIQMIDYYTNYSERTIQHWCAAQSYSRLYRECQFFMVHYADMPFGELIRTLHDICNELHDLNLTSPNVDDKSYNQTKDSLEHKSYPVDRLLQEMDTIAIEGIIDTIKRTFSNSKIEIYVFGSYVTKAFYNDIDMAVIIYEIVDRDNANSKAIEIEKTYGEIPLDITVIYEADLNSGELIPLLKNIQKGNCLYRSPQITIGLQDRKLNQPDYKQIINSYYDNLINNGSDSKRFIEDAYNCYYYIIAAKLDSNGIVWSGESTLIYEFKKLSSVGDNDKILTSFLELRKKKHINNALINTDEEFKNKTMNDIKDIINTLQ